MFTTPIDIPESLIKIDYQKKIMAIGSCFSENIGTKLQDAFFLTYINPFGVLYNPSSIENGVNILCNSKQFDENDLIKTGSLWSCLDFSSLYSGTSPQETLQIINSRMLAASDFFQQTDILIITLGTTWVYEWKDTGRIVANCHKLPSQHFNRRRMTIYETIECLDSIVNLCRRINSALEFIFTVSPIRHWKDGAHENNISKGILHLAIDYLEKKHQYVHYFPAYEIMCDELRDYRYYASDMFHPSDMAIEYIWKRFAETYFSENTLALKKELEQIRASMNHRPIHANTSEYALFCRQLEKKKAALISRYPFLQNRF